MNTPASVPPLHVKIPPPCGAPAVLLAACRALRAAAPAVLLAFASSPEGHIP